MNKLPILLIFVMFLSILTVSAQEPTLISEEKTVDLMLFYGQGCPHCGAEEAWLEEIELKYPNLVVHRYEVYSNKENRQLFQRLSEAHGVEVGEVPTTFINGHVITGFSDRLAESIEQAITYCTDNDCQSCFQEHADIIAECLAPISITGDSSPAEDPTTTAHMNKLTIGAVLGAAAIDAINPCAFAVLIILLTTILAAGKKKRVLMAGLAFTLSIYISYLLMGVGLFSAIQAAGFTRIFYFIVAVLALLVGLFNLKDYLWYGKWFIMEVPQSWRPKMKMLLKGVTSVPGAFLIGFLISLFLLPCTSGPYIVILGLLAETTTRNYAFMLLMLYNLIFILPMLIITLAIYFGFTTTAKAEEWRQRKLKVLHLIAGVLMLTIGCIMFVSIYLGYI